MKTTFKSSARKALLIPIFIGLSALLLTSCGKKNPLGVCTSGQNTFTANQELAINDNTVYKQLAQTFVAASTTSISTVQVYLFKDGTLADAETVTAEIWSNNATTSQPSALQGSGSVTANKITANGSFVSITISATNLTRTQTYWLVLRTSYAQSAVNLIKWARTSGTTDVLTNGQAYYINFNGGATYQTTGANQDFAFRIGDCIS